MNELKHFVESSLTVTKQITDLLVENDRLKKENDELKSKQGAKLEPSICDLMPIGETFCGLKVICTTNNAFRHAGVDGGDESEWINETTARAIYKAEMELRELRKMVK